MQRILAVSLVIAVTGCAYPQRVKDAAVAQGALIDTVKQGADALGVERVEKLEQTGRLTFQGAVAGECRSLLADGCERGNCLSTETASQLATSGNDIAGAFREAAATAATQNEILDGQLALMQRAQDMIEQYVGIDVTIGDDNLKALDDAAKSLNEKEAAADKTPAAPGKGGTE